MGSGIMCLAVLFLGMITSTATVCLRGQTFGDNCEYLCHCAGGQACGADGSCSNGCADGWEGEYCQRGNVTAGKSSSTSQSSTDGSYSSSLALDGSTNQSFTRCSHTTNQDQPWWQVDLGRKYVLFTVKIWNGEGDARDVVEGRECKTTQRGSEYRGTMSTTRKGFTCEDWSTPNPQFVHGISNSPANSSNYCRSPDYGDNEPWCYTTETLKANRWDYCDVPWCRSKLKNFEIFMDNNPCYHYTGMVNFGKAVDIRCVTPVVGQVLKIQLMDSSTVLTLCEVNVQGFLYKGCTSHHYGPNCNNRCQCANEAKCNDTTGACTNELCNEHFTGPYCNIEIPTVIKDGPFTPTSISVKWTFYRPHDSAYDAGKVQRLDLIYQDTAMSSSSLSVYYVNHPSPKMMQFNKAGLKPSTQYRFRVLLTWSRISTASVAKNGPTATFRTASCEGYMAMPEVISVTSNVELQRSGWPNRASLEIKAKVPYMISECFNDLEVYAKKTTESEYWYKKLTKAGQTYTLHWLTAFTEYDIKATVTSPDGKQKDNVMKIRTAEDVPSAPTIDKARASPTSITIRITPPDPLYGVITNYSLEMWTARSSGKTYTFGPTTLTYTINELKPSTVYYFKAKAFTSCGDGHWTSAIQVKTGESLPGPPNTLIVEERTASSLVLAWTKPKDPNGILKDYRVICTPLFSYNEAVNRDKTSYGKVSNAGPDMERLKIFGLTPATEYNCSVAAQTEKGYGPSFWLKSWTKPEVPGPPNTLLVEERTTSSLVLVWTKPKEPNGILKNYKVICTPLYSYDENVNAKRGNYAKEANSGPDETQLVVSGLTPATEYNCSVAARTSKDYGPGLWRRSWTKPEEAVIPEHLFPSVSSGKTTDSTITVEVPKMPKSWEADSISKVHIAVEKLEKRPKRSTSMGKEEFGHLTDYGTAKKKGYPGYIAAELSTNFSGPFVIGDGKTYGGYYNAPLTKGKMYDVIFGMVFLLGGKVSVAYRRYGKPITVGRIISPPGDIVIGLVAGLTIGILVILAVIIIPVRVIFIRSRRAAERRTYAQPMPVKDAPRNEGDHEYEELDTALHDRATYYNIPRANEIPLYENIVEGGRKGPHENVASIVHNEEYENPYMDIYANSMLVLALVSEIQEKQLEQEFTAIPCVTSTTGQDSREASMDIIPFEFNQVKVSSGKGNINASFIKSQDKATAYIAAKDPETGMANEMWEMIWQNQCTAVVMLTTPSDDKDKGKMYWHSEGSEIYGEIKVTVLEEEEAGSCIRRTFKLSKGSQIQPIVHLQLLKWPGDSRRPRVLLDMLKSVSRHFAEAGPLLVHCSDGSDRTGTVIALDILIKEAESTDEDFSYRRVNVADRIKILRVQRPGMVSSLSHYKFIHDALVEHFLVGRTAIKRAKFMEDFGELSNILPYRDCSRLEELLQLLAYFTPPISSFNFSVANAGVKINKNQDRDILADDDHRVKLVSTNGNDYINAVFVQGYQEPPYIVTQMPLPNTLGDFWKLVRDESVTTIVMLNQEEAESRAVYWPTEGLVQDYETFSVECIERYSHPQVTMRDFKLVSNKLLKKETIVRQFQLFNWPEDAMVPSNPSSMVQLVNMVDEWNSTNPKAKILVHCMNGAKRSGVFCVAHAATAQMKSENEVDIFNLTREVIACRPQFADCWQLLEFVHEVVGEYLSNNEN